MRISIIVPAFEEEGRIGAALESIPPDREREVLVVDGGSHDRTRAVAEEQGATTLGAPLGRGTQMNTGAAASSGEVLLFLHADTRLPPDALSQVRLSLADPRVVGGAFRLSIEGKGWFYPLVSLGANLRARLLGLPYGDACYFVRRADFEALGGYRNLPHCEDLDFIRRLHRRGRVVLAPSPVVTSGRRWERHGRARILGRNLVLFLLYWLGQIGEGPPVAQDPEGLAHPQRQNR